MLDATVVNVALQDIGDDFDADFATLQWTVNSYALTLAGLILLGGSLGDHFGRRRVFAVGAVWFAVASLLCGLAPNAEALVAARALQGVGGALLTPGSLALISASFVDGDRARAVGAWSGLAGLAGALGPFVGGGLVELSWRAVFLINLPVAALVVAITLQHVPESRDEDTPHGLDVPGAVLAAAGLGTLTYALTAAGEDGLGPATVLMGLASVALLAAFVATERRSPHPMMPISMFANRLFSAANLVTLLIYSALGIFFFLLVLELQTVAGFTPLVAGTALLPVTALMLLLSARSGALAERIGPRWLMTVGPLLAASGFLLTLRIGPDASYFVDVLPATVLLGLGLSATVAPLTSTVLGAADRRFAGTASGINNAVARTAGLLAVAVIPAAAGLSGDDYTDAIGFDDGFDIAMITGAGLLVAAGLLSALLIRKPTSTPEMAVDRMSHCPVCGPQLHPAESAPAR